MILPAVPLPVGLCQPDFQLDMGVDDQHRLSCFCLKAAMAAIFCASVLASTFEEAAAFFMLVI